MKNLLYDLRGVKIRADGCPTCGRGVERLVIMGPDLTEQVLVGLAAEVLWEELTDLVQRRNARDILPG